MYVTGYMYIYIIYTHLYRRLYTCYTKPIQSGGKNKNKSVGMQFYFYSTFPKIWCERVRKSINKKIIALGTTFSCILGHTEEIKMTAALLTAALKTFGRN